MHLCIRTRAILSLKSSPQVSQQKCTTLDLERMSDCLLVVISQIPSACIFLIASLNL